MRKAVWPVGKPEEVITDDRPLRQIASRLLWKIKGREVRTMTMDRPTHAMRPELVVSMAANIECPKSNNIAHATPSDLKAVAALEAINA